MKHHIATLLLACLPLLVGCGDGLIDVTGSVTVKGTPVEEGRITFKPVGEGEIQGARIDNGNYTARVTPGETAVEISGSKKIGMEKQNPADESSPMVPVMEEMVPKKYQRDSSLKATIKADMEPLNFDLDAK